MTRPRVTWTALAAAAVLGWLALGAGPGKVVAQGKKPDKSENHVQITATADKPGADGKQTVTVVLQIDPNWHIFANPAINESFEKEATKIKTSIGGKPADIEVEYPKGRLVEDKVAGNFRVYENKVTIKGTVQRPAGAAGDLHVTVSFMACNDKEERCLSHADVEQPVK
jgi:hypothetical protein